MSNSLWRHGLQHTRLPCTLLPLRVCGNSCPLNQWCHPTISSYHPFLLLPSVLPRKSESVSHSVVPDSATPWTVAHQAPLSMEFSRQEYWSGLPFPSPGDLPKLRDQTQVSCIAGRFFTVWASRVSLSLPAPGPFPMSWLCTSSGQRTGVSTAASVETDTVLPMNIQAWFPLRLTGLISLQSKGLSRVFSKTTVQNYQSFGVLPSLWVYHAWLLLCWGRFPFRRNFYHKLSGEFYHKCMFNFIKRLFCFYWDDHIIFIP